MAFPARLAKDLDEFQDLFGQFIRVRLYTPICLCYAMPELSSIQKSQIISVLRNGLDRLARSFPFLTGQVIMEAAEVGQIDNPKITPRDKDIKLIVKDFAEEQLPFPSFDELKRAQFPNSMLNGEVLAPIKGIGVIEAGEVAPVLILQANFINGGLILTFAGEHSIMDGQGLGHIMKMFSSACHQSESNSEPFSVEELLQGNRYRGEIVPLLDTTAYTPGPEVEHVLAKPPDEKHRGTEYTPSPSSWAYYHFSKTSLAKLKSMAAISNSDGGSKNPRVPYTTTNDAASAFIWQAVCRSRITPELPPDVDSYFVRAVDVRSALEIPSCYLGNMTNHTTSILPLREVPEMSLSTVSTLLRFSLNPTDLEYSTRAVATLMSMNPDRTNIRYGAHMNFARDVWFSSWARLPCYQMDCNLGLGMPVSVRRPCLAGVESLMYFMPMDNAGGVDVAVCLNVQEMERLKNDKTFGEFAEYIG